jgi:hypothetical protein
LCIFARRTNLGNRGIVLPPVVAAPSQSNKSRSSNQNRSNNNGGGSSSGANASSGLGVDAGALALLLAAGESRSSRSKRAANAKTGTSQQLTALVYLTASTRKYLISLSLLICSSRRGKWRWKRWV